MFLSILAPVLVLAALGLALRSRRNGLIGEHRYANRYSDAAGARPEDFER